MICECERGIRMNSVVKSKVLVIDDEKSNILALTKILSGNYTILAAKDGAYGIEVAQKNLPDIILLDILMPGMNGYETIQQLKAVDETKDIPVIFITGLASAEDEKYGLSLGASDYITKPFGPEIVKLRIQHQLSIRMQMRALDRLVQQQTLVSTISKTFLNVRHKEEMINQTLSMVGDFLGVDQILFYLLHNDQITLECRQEWRHGQSQLATRVGECIKIQEPMLSLLPQLIEESNEICFTSNDASLSAMMRPYRLDFKTFITIPIYRKGHMYGLLDISKSNADNWTELEISLCKHVSSILSAVFERDEMQHTLLVTELAEKSSRQRSEFLSRISHEMRTPMNAIMGMTMLAKKVEDREKQEVMLDKVSEASTRLLRLIDDVLDISDMQDNRFALRTKETHFIPLLQGILNKVGSEIRGKQQSLTPNIDSAIPEVIIVDDKRLAQVIQSLIENAIKFTPKHGAIQVNAFVKDITTEEVTMQIEVIDNGIGISRDELENVFTPFEQVDGGIDRKFEGVGLGLSITKNIINHMDGEIWVESEEGHGSKFSFTFKAKLMACSQKIEVTGSLVGKTILIAEDVQINQEIVMAMLEDTGVTCELANNGQEVVSKYREHPDDYDLILMDINMPYMDGVDATKCIRAIESGTEYAIPIISMTANVLISEVETYFKAGMNDHIGKPIDYDKLIQTLHKFLL